MQNYPTIKAPLLCLAAILIGLVVSAINPFDRFTWVLEIIPTLVVIPLLVMTFTRFRFTSASYILVAVHANILAIGGHYTYARVPLFDWIRDEIGSGRNSYDGIGHFAQGFIPAFILRELLIRTSPLHSGKWLSAIVILCCLGISSSYELIEWIAAILSGGDATDFLGTQNDPWDTQKDMALAGIGALACLILTSHLHNHLLLKEFPSLSRKINNAQ